MEQGAAAAEAFYPWYGLADNDIIEQGDFFFRFPAIVPVYPDQFHLDATDAEVDVKFFDVIVLSQSCDLKFGKAENVLVCPHFDLTTAKAAFGPLRASSGRKEARQGKLPGYHALNTCSLEGFVSEVRIVNFYQVFAVPFSYASSQVQSGQPRLRLLPPYREHLAQAFARFVMRVGLPQDIPAFE
jgi:hypothetical protein